MKTLQICTQKTWFWIQKNAQYIILAQAVIAMIVSLYLSDIKGYAPCVLCWYQRIAMYSLIPILIIGFLRKDEKAYHYVVPIACVGWIIALYHNLLYTGIIKAEESCSFGISCTTKYVEYFGFVTIPLMSLAGFSVILILSVIYRRWLRKNS